MNVSALQNLSWLGATALVAALGWTLYDFRTHEAELTAHRPTDFFRDVLEDVERPEPIQAVDVEYDQVVATFHTYDWTGAPPREVVQPTEVETAPTVAGHTPAKDLVSVLFARAATFDPSLSQALLKLDHTGFPAKRRNVPLEVKVGDHLPAPHDGVWVADITGDGVLFAFADEARERELLETPVLPGVGIVEVGPGGARNPIADGQIRVVANPAPYRPDRTVPMGSGRYRVGTQDADEIAQDFPSMISACSPRRHRDSSTGNYDGVELRTVPEGSLAANHGAKSGDVVKSINGHPVTSTQEAIQYVTNNSDVYSVWEVIVENKGVERTIVYEMPD